LTLSCARPTTSPKQIKPAIKEAAASITNAGNAVDAENTYQVLDWLWTSGQLSERDIRMLPSFGIDVVIHLVAPTGNNILPNEADLLARQGITYVQVPVASDKPKLEQFIHFMNVLDDLKGRNLWVHCTRNARASAFVYLYRRLVLGHSEKDASFPMREVWTPNETWQVFISEVMATYRR
jgi:protein tyrosine phosphatase (PTP) superfamily phosphohydrolase (DUF442 family)